MAHKIEGTRITLTRGDSLFLQISLTKNGEAYVPDPAAVVRFAMKEKYSDPEPLLIKNIPVDTLLLELKPEDTKSLEMGKMYVYDIQLTDEIGLVDTFISGILKIDNEVD